MKTPKNLILLFVLFNLTTVFAQDISTTNNKFRSDRLTLEPAIGIKPYPNSDALLSNVLQWNPKQKLNFISYTAYAYNNAFQREFNYVETNYNYTLSQHLGIGTSFYSKHSSHTISFLAGIKYDAYKETLNNPEFEKVSMSVSNLSPDFGLMYNLKIGSKKYFFSYRMYLPLYPYPFKSTDINTLDGNLANLTMEFGIGVRLK